MIQDKFLTIPAGDQATVLGTGTFIGILDCSDTTQELQVVAQKQGGEVVLNARMMQGERVTLPKKFDQFWIENTGNADVTVIVLVGDGRFESGRLTGAVALENAVNVSELTGSRLGALGEIEPEDYSNVVSYTEQAATTALKTLVSPAANVNGIHVRHAATFMVKSQVMAKETAPTSWQDAGAICLAKSIASTTNGYVDHTETKNILIPAGYGLYFQAGSSSISSCVMVNYEVL